MISIAERKAIAVPSAADLRRTAQRLAIDSFPAYFEVPSSDLEKVAAAQGTLMKGLDDVPGAVQALLQDHGDEQALRIAAVRLKEDTQRRLEIAEGFPPRDTDSLWLGISDLHRGVLGEGNAGALLFSAEQMVARAGWDQELAARLADPRLRQPDPALARAAMALDVAAEATAARNALQAQQLIDSAPEMAQDLRLHRATGPLGGPPTKRYIELIDPDARAAIAKCSKAVAKRLNELDEGSLAALAGATAKAWSNANFDPNLAALQGQLARERDSLLRAGLGAARQWDAAGNDLGPRFTSMMGAELQKLDSQRAELPEAGNPDRLMREDLAAAVVHDASQRVLLERSAERAGPSQESGREAGPDLGMDF